MKVLTLLIFFKKFIIFRNSGFWNLIYSIHVLLNGRNNFWKMYIWSCIVRYGSNNSCLIHSIRWWSKIEQVSRRLVFVYGLKKKGCCTTVSIEMNQYPTFRIFYLWKFLLQHWVLQHWVLLGQHTLKWFQYQMKGKVFCLVMFCVAVSKKDLKSDL